MKKSKKRSPNDYPLFLFRLPQEAKEALHGQIEQIVKEMNKRNGPDERKVRKNDVILQALEIGLIKIRKKNHIL